MQISVKMENMNYDKQGLDSTSILYNIQDFLKKIIIIIFLFPSQSYVMGTQKNHLNEMVLLSTQNVAKLRHEISNNGMWNEQSLRSACPYAQSDQSLC